MDSFSLVYKGFIGGLGIVGLMLISGFNAYLRVYWILRNGATLGGYKKGCKGVGTLN